jgi:hypothetical protein
MYRLAILLALAAGVRAPPVWAAAHVLDNGRVHVAFADPASGFTTKDADRVDGFSWIDSNGVNTGNLVANGGPLHCNDPQEYFGQAYGEAGSAHPFLVFGGDTASWNSSSALSGKTKVNTAKVCDFVPDGGTHTSYTLSTQAGRINEMTVVRTFTFAAVNSDGNIRAYVPRLPSSGYSTVYWRNAAGVEQTGNVGGCAGGCEISDWDGVWFAEQNAAGQGLLVIRNPAKGLPAVILFDNDSFSASNNSAVALKMPAGGWTGTVSEKETLCLYDAKSWLAAARAAGRLPKGCTKP